MIITELFKSLCHEPPKRVIRPICERQESALERPRIEYISPYQAQALKRYRAEREQLERARERQEHEVLMLFVRIVNESRRG